MPETTSPLVGIVMGSDSDWPKIKAAAAALDEFGVPYEVRVMSAHRTPEIVRQYATTAAARGLEGDRGRCRRGRPSGRRDRLAHHFAGRRNSRAHRALRRAGFAAVDRAQMPGDVPVATVGLGGGGPRNAGLLAVQILALGNAALQEKLAAFKRSWRTRSSEKDAASEDAARRKELRREEYKRREEKREKNSRGPTARGEHVQKSPPFFGAT